MDNNGDGPDHRPRLAALRRVEGQVRGVAGMIEQGRYCIDILTQLQAARAALMRIERNVLTAHMEACVVEAVAAGGHEEQQRKLAEITELLRRSMR